MQNTHTYHSSRVAGCLITVDTFTTAIDRAGVSETITTITNTSDRAVCGDVETPDGTYTFDLGPYRSVSEWEYRGGTAEAFYDAWFEEAPNAGTETHRELARALRNELLAALDDDAWGENAVHWVGSTYVHYPNDRTGTSPSHAGMSPYRFEWRKCGPGYALALREAVGVSNQYERVYPAEDTRTLIGTEPHTSGFALSEYRRCDARHFSRHWGSLVFLAKAGHRWGRFMVRRLLNQQLAIHTRTTSSTAPRAAWSLARKNSATHFWRPNEFCDLGGVMQATFANEARKAFQDDAGAARLNSAWYLLFAKTAPHSEHMTAGPKGITRVAGSNEHAEPYVETFEAFLAAPLLLSYGLAKSAWRIAQHPHLRRSPAARQSLTSGWREGTGVPFSWLLVDSLDWAPWDGSAVDLLFASLARISTYGVDGTSNPLDYMGSHGVRAFLRRLTDPREWETDEDE